MVEGRIFEGYPEGFSNWNERFFDLFIEGVNNFPPELILGAIESLKILYLNRGIEIQKSNTLQPEVLGEPTEEDIKFNEENIGEQNEQTGEEQTE